MESQGYFDHYELREIFQLLWKTHRSGVLTVASETHWGTICIREGRPIDAFALSKTDPFSICTGEHALLAPMLWDHGEYSFIDDPLTDRPVQIADECLWLFDDADEHHAPHHPALRLSTPLELAMPHDWEKHWSFTFNEWKVLSQIATFGDLRTEDALYNKHDLLNTATCLFERGFIRIPSTATPPETTLPALVFKQLRRTAKRAQKVLTRG
jgi:hypothetical protein